MTNKSRIVVANPPARPLLIWDGDCHFCARWIERWRELTGGAIDYETSQNVADRYPEISRDQFGASLVFIETDGRVFLSAEAAFQSLRHQRSRKWLSWSYEHVPGFAPISDTGYKLIARHRQFASLVTRLLWGNDVRPPTYLHARTWFLRLLGLVYLIAFVSLWTQIDGLAGTNGIWPIKDVLPMAQDELGSSAHWLLPTLCWFNTSNAFLLGLCGTGAVFSLVVIVGIAPAISLAALFVLYLSLTTAGQTFLSFQWDILLLETGFLSIFIAPWTFWRRPVPLSRPSLFLLKFLLFKLMLMSGVVKLTSGDDSWLNLTALDYHYWSQPLPTVFAWYADKSPEWFKQFSVALCLFIEIVVPFFIWAPRRPRLIAAGLLIFLQIAIAITGNYCFFNLLTIALCVLLIDDGSLRLGRRPIANLTVSNSQVSGLPRMQKAMAMAIILVTLPINAWLIFNAFKPEAEMPRALAAIYARIDSFHVVNGYGLFRVMTRDREEIIIEGSQDGFDWRPYEFKWKPGDVKRAPGWCAPHQPRLDWQMWFAALSSAQRNPWLVRTLACLLQDKSDVKNLLGSNPFPNSPPRYVRAMYYRYRFSSSDERRQTGAWWTRQELREYLPPISREDLK